MKKAFYTLFAKYQRERRQVMCESLFANNGEIFKANEATYNNRS